MNDSNDGFNAAQAKDAVQTKSGPKKPAAPAKPKPKPKPKANVLNEDKPFGSVHGHQGKARYFQDGKYFDGAGNLCDDVE